ncbi:MAG TPA: hypothetical protein VF518_04255, partial [Polyangia bacterium]
MTYADLTRQDLGNSSITEAKAALDRIRTKSSPMPPSPMPGPTSTEITTLQSWVDNGYPSGSCGVSGSGGGGAVQPGSAGGRGGGLGGGSGGSSQIGAGGSGGGSGGKGGTAGGGLPCDVQTFLVNNCSNCHGSIPAGGAPRSLVTYADLTQPDLANAAMTEAQVALQRLQSTTSPMPPAPAAAATSAQITMLQGWISNGYPTGSCSAGGSGGGGAAGAGGSGAGGTGHGGSGGNGGSSQVGSGGAGGIADAGTAGGSLPCDVQTVLVNRCESCHGTTPSGGAPRSLVTYSDLTRPDLANASMTEAQVALQRMQSTTSPMPPSPAAAATAAEIATLQNWVSNGYP